jgi:hypothetical protein
LRPEITQANLQKDLVSTQKAGISGDFLRPNLMMRENLEVEGFQQALIPNGL